ncbi:MAG TPA: hypothetical protein VMG08_10530 [Allosphingosinicella sp.]|nr:hypothetical protein [Allosphingosinicella sp.]
MAVEDHPRFQEWREALDALQEAVEANRNAANAEERRVARAILVIAYQRFHNISDEIE